MVALGRQGSTASSPAAHQLSLVDADWLTGSDGKQPSAVVGRIGAIGQEQSSHCRSNTTYRGLEIFSVGGSMRRLYPSAANAVVEK